MRNHTSFKKGLTLTETLFSIILLVIVWLSASQVIVISKVSGSVAKHKIHAIYVAERTMEELHRKTFSQIANNTSVVSIDTKGTPDNYSDDLMGTRVTTVTSPSTYYKKALVEVSWNEKLGGSYKLMKERCASYIADDPQIN